MAIARKQNELQRRLQDAEGLLYLASFSFMARGQMFAIKEMDLVADLIIEEDNLRTAARQALAILIVHRLHHFIAG